MSNLFPEGYENELITLEDIEEEESFGYKNGPSFDYDTGDFRRDGKNKVMDSNGIESWRAWCINCVSTERYKHLAYSTDFGIETEPAFKATSREEAESFLSREITEAIMADPYKRADYVSEIKYEWTGPDAVNAYVVIQGKEDVTIDITAYITKGDI